MVQTMKQVNGFWYWGKSYDGYKTRAKIEFKLIDGTQANIDIYTNQTDRDEIRKAINQSMNRKKCATFEIVHFSSKEQDDLTSKFLDKLFPED